MPSPTWRLALVGLAVSASWRSVDARKIWTPKFSSYVHSAGYNVTQADETATSTRLVLVANAPTASRLGDDLKEPTAEFFVGENAVRVKITDKNNERWEVPRTLYGADTALGRATWAGAENATNVAFTYARNPFSFQVTRKTDGYVLFDSSTLDLVVKDQYLQIATKVPSDLNVYGIGESSRDSMRLQPGEKHTLWARDEGSFAKNANTYGSHPFFLGLNDAGKAHGVLLLNSNGMDVTLEKKRLVYQAIGGIFDFTILSGPSPADVVAQYTSLIGKPKLMPYWSYGFHQCRWGYKNVSALREVVAQYDANQIPLDVLWADIDYMDRFHDFTLDPVNFPVAEMQKLLKDVHAEGKRFVPIIDPGIPDDPKDIAYTRGLELDIFIKDPTGKPYLGQVWPGPTVFPDFFHPNTSSYWHEQLARLHDTLPYDGLWIDMNELADFCPGTVCVREQGVVCPHPDAMTTCCLKCEDDHNRWNHPPFAINNGNRKAPITNGISTSSLQFGNIRQYNSHNLYGFTESIATNAAQEKILGKRSFVLSRSTFPGNGAHATHWTGDNGATWNDIKWSIVTILNFGLFGLPMVGADICGFMGPTTEELCARWTALGALYPFARNHNNLGEPSQETYVWESVAAIGRKFIGLRYRLLPYLYTLGYAAHVTGAPIARPLFWEFPEDKSVHKSPALDRQFLLGSSLLVTPVLDEGASSVTGYVPEGRWYDVFTYARLDSKGKSVTWNVKLDDLPVLVRGGSVLPLHQPGVLTSAAARRLPLDLLVALSGDGTAGGSLYWDDGEDLEGVNKASIIDFRVEAKRLVGTTFTSHAVVDKFGDAKTTKINKLVVLGVETAPINIIFNGSTPVTTFTYTKATQQLQIELLALNISITDDFSVFWDSAAAQF